MQTSSSMLSVTHGAALDAVQSVVVRQKRKAADDEKHHGGRGDQNSYFFLHRDSFLAILMLGWYSKL